MNVELTPTQRELVRKAIESGRIPEGASVTVLAFEGDETFEANAETEKMLLEAMAQCRRGQTTRLKDVLVDMRARE